MLAGISWWVTTEPSERVGKWELTRRIPPLSSSLYWLFFPFLSPSTQPPSHHLFNLGIIPPCFSNTSYTWRINPPSCFHVPHPFNNFTSSFLSSLMMYVGLDVLDTKSKMLVTSSWYGQEKRKGLAGLRVVIEFIVFCVHSKSGCICTETLGTDRLWLCLCTFVYMSVMADMSWCARRQVKVGFLGVVGGGKKAWPGSQLCGFYVTTSDT